MARGKKRSSGVSELGYEVQLWKMADALHNSMDAAEYKHVVLGFSLVQFAPLGSCSAKFACRGLYRR